MESGYIKLWRAISGNELLANDNTCWIVFTKLLLLVDKNTGAYRTGRKRLAALCNLNENTLYSALKRLETSTIIQQQSNNTSTTIYICKWAEYQQPVNNKSTAEQRDINTKQEERKRNNIYMSNSPEFDQLHQLVCDLFSKSSNRFKLSDTRKQKLRLRLKEFSADDIAKAFRNLARSKFHRGDNKRGWKVDSDPYWLLNSYERTEQWVNYSDIQISRPVPGASVVHKPHSAMNLSKQERLQREYPDLDFNRK